MDYNVINIINILLLIITIIAVSIFTLRTRYNEDEITLDKGMSSTTDPANEKKVWEASERA